MITNYLTVKESNEVILIGTTFDIKLAQYKWFNKWLIINSTL